jgi:hypothetical protein
VSYFPGYRNIHKLLNISERGELEMNKIFIKVCIIVILLGVLAYLVFHTKKGGDNAEQDKVTLTEKYFAPSHSPVAIGVKSQKEIKVIESDRKKCAMEFSNKKRFEVDCDKYLDFKIGDQVVITHQNDKLVKLGKK